MNRLVGIVILNWNGYEDSCNCLRSLMELNYHAVKVWVVDNASSNNEADRLKVEFPWANIVPLKENIGFCGGCNEGMKKAMQAGAEYIMLLNNDALVTPSLLDELITGYSSLKNPGAVSPLIMHYPETEKIWFSEAKWMTNWSTGEAGFSLNNGKEYDALSKLPPYKSEFACGCCLFVSAAVVKQIGLFDERYFAFFDEAEWCARMNKKGFQSYSIPTAKMFHKVGGTVPSLVMTYLITRNKLLWIRENLSWFRKLNTWPAVAKDIFWHWRNIRGKIPAHKQYVSPKVSEVCLRGFRDYKKKKFGKWDKSLEKLLFPKS